MISRATILVLLGWALFSTAPAIAKDMRFPESGNPAFSFRMPDDWTSRKDDVGNLLLSSGDRSTGFSLSLVDSSQSLDDFANGALGVAKADDNRVRAVVSISGFPGVSYTTTMMNPSGVKLRVKMVVVRPDKTHIASCTKIEADNNSAEQRKVAETVLQSMTLSAAP